MKDNTTNDTPIKVIGQIDLSQFERKPAEKRERIYKGNNNGLSAGSSNIKANPSSETIDGDRRGVEQLPDGTYSIDYSKTAWRMGAVIFYDSRINMKGRLVVSDGWQYGFNNLNLFDPNTTLKTGELVLFCMKMIKGDKRVVDKVIPIDEVSRLPWKTVLKYVGDKECISFDYSNRKYSFDTERISVPVIKTCLKKHEADVNNLMKSVYQLMRKRTNEEIDNFLQSILPCGIGRVFSHFCLNTDYITQLMIDNNEEYLTGYRLITEKLCEHYINRGKLSVVAKAFSIFDGLDEYYAAFIDALNAKVNDWAALNKDIVDFPQEENSDFLLDILNRDSSYKLAPEVLLAMYLNKVDNDEDKASPYLVLLKSIPECDLNKDSLIQIIQAQESTDKTIQILDCLPYSFAKQILSESFDETNLSNTYFKHYWQKAKNIEYACIDIESDGQTIREVASVCGEKRDLSNSQEGLLNFIKNLSEAVVLIGHNINNWDIPILARNGFVSNEKQCVWDTYEMELALCPTRFSYALETQHSALEDARLCEKLFWNQLFRISVGGEKYNYIIERLPNVFRALLTNIGVEEFRQYVNEELEKAPSFFRQSTSLDNGLREKLVSISGRSLILAPKDLWPAIADIIDVVFPSTEEYQYLAVDKSNIEGNERLSEKQKAILMTFVMSNRSPLIIKLSRAARLYVTDEVLASLAVEPSMEEGIICTDSFGIEKLGDLSRLGITDIYSTGYEIESRMNSSRVGDSFCAADLLKNQVGAKLLMQLSGVSYVPLTRQDCEILHLPEPPADVQNIWMHKDEKGLFQVFCNRNFTEMLKGLSNHYPDIEQHQIEWLYSDVEESKISVIATKRNLRFNAILKRVSPASQYRSIYWAYQFGLIGGLSSSSVKVLFITNPAEVDPVCRYAEEKGYYVPTRDASVQRRIELCANRDSNQSLVVIGPEDFKTLRESKIEQRISFLWDNLDIESLQVMWRNLLPFGDEPEYEAERKEGEGGIPSALSCVLGVWPMVKYYYHQLLQQNPQNELILLDPCFDDYRELEQSFLAKRIEVLPWENEDAYRECVIKAQQYFSGAKKDEHLDIDFEHAKDTIRRIMLDPKVNTPPAKWTEIQEKALPQVFHRHTHSVISIPTGGGKSVLFQGPALYRTAFTNRLSLVVTPLKALMQDQINGLNELGFLTNVEYLNSDKSRPEASRLYRRVNGGEIALLYITPERFRSRAFRNALESRMAADGGLEYIIFDEAHCISQWGLDFRPEYLSAAQECAKIVERYPDTKIELFSATITGQVLDDIRDIINPITCIGTDEPYNPVRNHIGMEFVVTEDSTESRVDVLYHLIENSSFDPEQSRILVFSNRKSQTEEVCELLKESLSSSARLSGISSKIGYFHAGMDAEDRAEAFEKFRNGDYVILIATKAFGMGMDIPNIHFVYHLSPPQFIEDYLQEVGRAGRSREQYEKAGFTTEHPIPTKCFVSPEDFRTMKGLMAQGMLSWEDVRAIYSSVKDYVAKFQSIEEEQTVPVAVPATIWRKEKPKGAEVDTTAFRLGLYWLEQMQRIKMGYYANTTIDIQLPEYKSSGIIKEEKLKEIYDYILEESERADEHEVLQLNINEICSQLAMGQNTLFRYIIQGTRLGLFSVINKTAFSLTKLRTEEVKYCYGEDEKYFVIETVFKATELLLRSLNERESSLIDIDKRNEILSEALEHSGVLYAADDDDNREHMPWYSKARTGSITTKKTYVKDLSTKRGKYIFSIMDMLPKVSVKTQLDAHNKQVLQEVYVASSDWKLQLRKLKDDSIKLLNYLAEKFFNNERDFVWTEAINTLKLYDSYQHISDLISILRMLGFINSDGILTTGIEVTLEDNREDIPSVPTKTDGLDKTVFERFEDVRFLKDVKFALMDTFREIRPEQYNQFIQEYFACKTQKDYMYVLAKYNGEDSERIKALQQVAIKAQEERLDKEQRAVYDESIDEDINVIAGPGSGKTHVLTLRCARLIHYHRVLPQNILVLAYNRAVVEELKSRLSKLFNELGYGRSMSQLQVYTFHGLARKYCYDYIANEPMEKWETTFLRYVKRNGGEFRAALGNVQYILIDEFQDITQVRLDLMLEIRSLLKNGETYPRFFTIGDINQSIYGFDKLAQGNSMDPLYYYGLLKKAIRPKEMRMTTNYRSYQEILDAAFKFIPTNDKKLLPHSTDRLIPPEEPYVFMKPRNAVWYKDFEDIVRELQNKSRETADEARRINTIAVFFRSNSEVFRGYSHLRDMDLRHVRIRIQGASGEFFRTRECFSLINALREHPDNTITPEIKEKIHAFLENKKEEYSSWDSYYLDLTYALVLNYFENNPTGGLYSDLAEYLEDIGERDDGQLSKVMSRFESEFPTYQHETEIVLTTMHKVKGLEFDAVVITPSYQPLGYKTDGTVEDHYDELIEEERRLYYVAYTRAKKYLYVYKSERERRVEASEGYMPTQQLQNALGHSFQQGLDKFNLGYPASTGFRASSYIESQVEKNDEITLERQRYGWFLTIGRHTVGKLSNNESRILDRHCDGEDFIDGIFVSDVFVWRYEDTLRIDRQRGTDFAKSWSESAKERGYIYVVDIAGYTGE